MKQTLLILIFFAIAFSGQAQELHVVDDNLDKLVLACNLEGPEMVSQELKHELKLNEMQFAQVGIVMKELYRKLQEVETKYAADKSLLQRELRDIYSKNDKVLRGILRDNQMLFYLEKEGRLSTLYLSDKTEQE